MTFYLVENIMGFEKIIEEGDLENLKLIKRKYEKKPLKRKVGSVSKEFVISARYYIVDKFDWDLDNGHIMPVDLS